MSFIHSPGPGAYETKRFIGTKSGSSAYTMRAKTNIAGSSDSNPSPAAYRPSTNYTKTRAPSYSLRLRTSDGGANSRSAREQPGPGQYKTAYYIGRAPAKSMTSRRMNNMSSFTPGPGQYSLTASNLPKAPGYSLTGRSTMLSSSYQTPGPGSYSITKGLGGKGFTMTGRLKFNAKEGGVPGPGQYNTYSGIQTTKERAPRYTMRRKTNGDVLYCSSSNAMPGVMTVLSDGSKVR